MNHEIANVPVGFFLIDVLRDFDVKGVVILWLSRGSNTGDEKFKLGGSRPGARGVIPHRI